MDKLNGGVSKGNLPPFSPRESDIICFLIHGRSPKTIASFLSLSPRTVQTHIRNIMLKIDCSSRDGILGFVEKKGYLPFLRERYQRLNPELDSSKIIDDGRDHSQTHSKSLSFPVLSFILISIITLSTFIMHSYIWNEGQEKGGIIRSDLSLPSSTFFLERHDLQKKIEQAFEHENDINTVAIIGVGGAGKTTIARSYLRNLKGSIVWEINAETSETLKESFEKLAEALANGEEDIDILKTIMKDSKQKDKRIIQFVQNHLKKSPHWILFFDNVVSMKDIESFYPSDPSAWGKGNVLITTQDANISNYKHVTGSVHVEGLSNNQKKELFSKILFHGLAQKFHDRYDLDGFLEKISSFPLDVTIAANYIRSTNITFDDYLERLKGLSQEFEFLQMEVLQEVTSYNKTRSGIVIIALKNLMKSHKDFGNLIIFVSLLNSQDIPRSLLVAYKDRITVDNFIRHMKKYSLITSDKSGSQFAESNFSLHRSTPVISLEYMSNQANFQINESLLMPMAQALRKEMEQAIDQEDTQKMQILAKHAEMFLSHKKFVNDPIRVALEGKLGFIYFSLGNYERAGELLKKSLAMHEVLYGKVHSKTASAMKDLGIYYRNILNPTAARGLLELSLKIYKKHMIEDYQNISDILIHLSHVYKNLGDYIKAKELIEQGIETLLKNGEKESVRLGTAFIGLGIMNINLGKYLEADNFIVKGVEIYTKHLPKFHIRQGWALTILGENKRNLGHYSEAKKLLKQGGAVYEKYYGSNHFETAKKYLYLSQAYVELGEKENALNLSRKNYQNLKKYFGDSHISTAEAAVRLGESLCLIGDFEQAKELMEESYLIYEKYYGKNNILTLNLLISIGELYAYIGNFDSVEKKIKSAEAILEEMDRPNVYISLELLANIYVKRSQLAQADKDFGKAKELTAQAKNYLEKALKLVEKSYTKDSPHWERIQSKLKNLVAVTDNR